MEITNIKFKVLSNKRIKVLFSFAFLQPLVTHTLD